MSFPPDSAMPLTYGGDAAAARSSGPSRLEEEVIDLFDRMRGRLLRYVLSLGLNAHDGEEVVQEVFLALFQHLRKGKSRDNLNGWLFRVAHNLGLKQRAAGRNERVDSSATEALEERRADPGPNPEQQVVNNQRQRHLLSVVKALSEQDQCCLRLRAEGLRYREIANVLGMSLGAVSISLTRSIARLSRADER